MADQKSWHFGFFWLGLLLALATLIGVAGWIEKEPLQTWYYAHGLATASPENRDQWIEAVLRLHDDGLAVVFECLRQPEEASCQNGGAFLGRLAKSWSKNDSRVPLLIDRLAQEFPTLSTVGQRVALEKAALLLLPEAGALTPSTRAAGIHLIQACVSASDQDVQGRALALCPTLLTPPTPEAIHSARELVQACLASPSAPVRVKAIQVALSPGLDLLEQVASLLARDGQAGDPDVEVRRAALLAVGPATSEVLDYMLLPSLHDSDAQVVELCKTALRGRQLSADQIHLGWLATHPDPVMRLQVLDHLGQASDLDRGVWIRRLSHDASPANRVAAMRVMSEHPDFHLSDRIDQMARTDPSPTVCQLGWYYLECVRKKETTAHAN